MCVGSSALVRNSRRARIWWNDLCGIHISTDADDAYFIYKRFS